MTSKSTLIKFYFLSSFMMLACNMVHPVTPAFLRSISMPDYMFGLAFAAMSFTNFLFSPFWGKLSDSVGRLRISSITLTGYAFSQLLFMVSGSVEMVLISRLVSGLFAGGFSVCCMIYLAEITDKSNRAKYTMYYVAFSSVSAASGYLLGGFIGDFSISATFITQFVLLLISALLYGLLLNDSVVNPAKIEWSGLSQAANPFSFFIQARSIMTPALLVFLVTIFFTSFAMSDYDNSLNYYLSQVFNFPPSYNGILKAIMGMIGLIANFTINPWLVRHTDGRKSIVFILVTCGTTLLIASSRIGLAPFLLWNVLFYCFNTMYLPIQQALVTDGQKESANGLIYGIFNSVKALGMIFGSLVAGFAYELENTLPFVIGGAVFFISAALALFNIFQYQAQTRKRTAN